MVTAQSPATDASDSSPLPDGPPPPLDPGDATPNGVIDPVLILEPPIDLPQRPVAKKIRQLFREEFAGLHLRLVVARTLLALLPYHVGGRVRAVVLRMVGFKIGRGTVMAGTPTFIIEGAMRRTLVIGTGCWINIDCLFDLGADIRLGNNVSLGHGVLLLTSSHDIGPAERRASTLSAKPLNIGNGAWLGSRSVILPGVSIGAGAVVAAGAVVHQDVLPNTLVAGVPARPIRALA